MAGGAAAVSNPSRNHPPKRPSRSSTIHTLGDQCSYLRNGGWREYNTAKKIYASSAVQIGVACLIGLNFIVNIIQAQIDPTGEKMNDGFGVFEWFFNIVFLFELALNMYAGRDNCKKWWKSGWNVFDFSVVLIGWMFQVQLPLPGPLKLLRMMRAFRVFRLFKRIKSLNKIMVALANAVPGVVNAFIIQLIVMCIYAIIAVDRFRDYGEGGKFTNELGEEIDLQTARGQDFGFEYFGDFGKALYTMFQVLTGESWSEAVCRPLFNSNSPTTSTGSAFFFVSFVVLNAVVLINVVVAVLLEKMVEDPDQAEAAAPAADDTTKALADPDGLEPHDSENGTPTHKPPPEPECVEDQVKIVMSDLADVKDQMPHVDSVAGMLRRAETDTRAIQEQLSALLAHHGIKVAGCQPIASVSTADSRLPPPPCLAAAARGDDPNGGGTSHTPPQTTAAPPADELAAPAPGQT